MTNGTYIRVIGDSRRLTSFHDVAVCAHVDGLICLPPRHLKVFTVSQGVVYSLEDCYLPYPFV
jgi:hypothetical protein